MTYEEAVDYIINIPRFNIQNSVKRDGQAKLKSSLRGKSGNDNLKAVMDLLGNPELNIRAIHIAGTNGKGSTATFVAGILRAKGYRVGVFTSPHLVKINERICIDGEDITDEDFLGCFIKINEAVRQNEKDGGFGLSFFEYLFAMSVVYFNEKRPDIVVYETGLGGRLDATNILMPLICGITSIGLDHTEYLGNTIEQIAFEKAGIIKSGVPIVYNTGSVEADAVIDRIATEKNACQINVAKTDYMINDFTDNGIDFSVVNSYYNYQNIKLRKERALYQTDNATTAIVLCNKLMELWNEDYLPKDIIQDGLDAFFWPGRMEQLSDNVIVDGAHNLNAIYRFVESVRSIESGGVCLLFAVAGDKDYEPMIEELCRSLDISFVCVTTLDSHRGISADYIAKIFDYYMKESDSVTAASYEILTEDDIEKALYISRMKAKEIGKSLYCVGSLYLIGSIKKLWRDTI